MRYIELLLAVLIFTVSCFYAQHVPRPALPRSPQHSGILEEKGEALRLVVLDSASHPIAGARIELREIVQCETVPCPPASVIWARKSGADGSVTIPRKLIHETIVVGTRVHEPREIQVATWSNVRKAWVIRLMGHVATVCIKLGAPENIRVAENWRSAQVGSDDMGLMHCEKGKDFFLICRGPQFPDYGLTAYFIRSGNRISARLGAESVAGEREIAQFDCFHLSDAEGIPRDLSGWTLEYRLAGGNSPLMRYLGLKQTGELDVGSRSDRFASHVTGHASAEVMAKITDFLKVAQQAGPAPPTWSRDLRPRSLALMSGGWKYELAVPEDLRKLLEDTMDTTLKQAVVGAWRESEWVFCLELTQLTRKQTDPAIQSLVFYDDGRFSVTWRGEKDRTDQYAGEAPQVSAPDYSGRYEIQPDHDGIHMSFDKGGYTPRYFSGDGYFQISEDKLSLRGVWLGTYKAERKPDHMCWLTFTRVSGPAHPNKSAH